MSIPLINFLSAPQGDYNTGIADMFGNMLKTQKMLQEPAGWKRKAEKEELANQIKRAEAEHAPEYYKEQARTGGLSNFAKMLENQVSQKYGMDQAAANLESTKAQTERYKNPMGYGGITQGQRMLNSLPAGSKENLYAQARGWGYTDDQTAIALASGKTLEDLKESARMSGIDVDNAEPVYAPTTANITQQKNMEGAGAELDVLEQETIVPIAKYGRTFLGYSPQQMLDALTGENTEDRIKFLAARALQPEIAGARTRIAGGSNAHEALRDMQEKSLGNIEVFRPLVSPEEYEGMQKELNRILKIALKARKNAVYNIEEGQKAIKKVMKEDKDPFGLGI